MRQNEPSDLQNTYTMEVVKEFVLRRLRLTPCTRGRRREDVPSVVSSIGGLQYGGHEIELLNRIEGYRSEWFDHWYRNYALIEGHVLRGALRIVTAEEYPYFFKATRSVARRRRYQNCPSSLSGDHELALEVVDEHGPLTHSEFKELYSVRYQRKPRVGRLLQDLYNHGEVARLGRKKQKPLYHTIGKLPYKLDMSKITEEDAKDWLLIKSLGAYGPLTAGDIAHWVGWNLNETRETLGDLLGRGEIAKVCIENDRATNYLRSRDIPLLNSISEDLSEHSFIRILFNDDALLLGYLPRLRGYFGYDWKYPQLSEGVVWRAGILCGREMIGDAVVEMYAKSRYLSVKELHIRRKFANPGTLSAVEAEFMRHAEFQNKSLELAGPKLV